MYPAISFAELQCTIRIIRRNTISCYIEKYFIHGRVIYGTIKTTMRVHGLLAVANVSILLPI